ncbi:MAG TPA: hypothetical protein VFG42_11210 [Baekduia sp.]|uniref:hypothetical protein n=1 Tax=Baekduia sp. TaxID=2600305 RepID=UPI002D76B0B9|nr:hypothetical protein [Baekduia sp.]HET6507347.1 hypothetical protein [Baekduia sp.]
MAEIETSLQDRSERIVAPTAPLHSDILERIGTGLEGAEAAAAMRGYLERLEDAMKEIASRHSRMYWLHLTRRLPPEPLGDSRPWTVTLYRRVLTLAVLKHGLPGLEGDFNVIDASDGRMVVPRKLTDQDVVDARALEYLAYEFNHATSAFRRIGKGAVLRVIDGDLRAIATDDVQAKMVAYDARVAASGTLSSSHGAAVDVDTFPEPGPSSPMPFAAWGLVSNALREPAEKLVDFARVRFDGPPNHMPAPFVLDHSREVLVRFEDAMRDAIGATPDALLASLFGLCTHMLKGLRNEPRLAHQMFNVGYYGVSVGYHYDGVCKNVADYVIAWWQRFLDETIDHPSALTIVKDAFEALTYSSDDLRDIDLWNRSPFRLILASDDQRVFDFSAIVEMTAGLFEAVGSIPGDPDSVKGSGFEQEISRRAIAAGLTPWKTGRVKLADGTEREVDASFVAGTTLWLVECKAIAQTPRIEAGDYAALKSRWERLEKHVRQAQTLAAFVATNRKGTNFEVPAVVENVEYCVCTPAPEWIPSDEPDLWLTPEIPRICTPDELLIILQRSRGA